MQSLADILTSVFQAGTCDFCETNALVYPDSETGCLYCLPCLAEATDPANQLEELPGNPVVTPMSREWIAARKQKERMLAA
jgi:hypothetical protein